MTPKTFARRSNTRTPLPSLLCQVPAATIRAQAVIPIKRHQILIINRFANHIEAVVIGHPKETVLRIHIIDLKIVLHQRRAKQPDQILLVSFLTISWPQIASPCIAGFGSRELSCGVSISKIFMVAYSDSAHFTKSKQCFFGRFLELWSSMA